MTTIVTSNRMMAYVQASGRGTGLSPMSKDRHGIGDRALAAIPDRGVLWGQDDFGRPESKVEFDQPPGGLNTFTIEYDRVASQDFLEQMVQDNGKFVVYNMFIPAGRLNNPTLWANNGFVDCHVRCKISGGTGGAGRQKDYSGDPVVNNFTVSSPKTITLFPPLITKLTTTDTNDANAIVFLSDLDPNFDLPGYPGRDQIGFTVFDAVGAGTAKVQYTVNGGGTWTNLASDPFTTSENILAAAVMFVSETTYRLVVLRSTADAAAPPEIAWADIVLGGEGGAITWNAVNLGSTNNDPGEALAWLWYEGMYAAGGGDIFRSTNQGVSFTQVYTGANAINNIVKDYDDNVWAVGAANTILRELSSNRGSFSALTGPSGGGAFTSIAVARDGWLYAGNGSSIFRSTNKAATTGGWTELKDFGTNHVVKRIQCIDGESQLIRALVTDTVGNDGDVWYSLDGGNSFVEVSDLTNAGYNDWYTSEIDPNLVFIAGEDDASTAIIHKLTV